MDWWYIPSTEYAILLFHLKEKKISKAVDITLPVAIRVIRSFSEFSTLSSACHPELHHPPEAKYIVIGHVLAFKNSISFSTYCVSIEDS